MATSIGIPMALESWNYFPLFKVFFEHLGCKVVTNGPTNKQIIETGGNIVVDETCLPCKVAAGASVSLDGKVDYILLHRFVSLRPYFTNCPKYIAFPDIMRLNLKTPILSPWVDYRRTKKGLEDALAEAAVIITEDKKAIKKAFRAAREVQARFLKLLYQQNTTPEAFDILFNNAEATKNRPIGSQVCIGVVGHPYILHDPYTSLQFIRKLREMGVYIVTNEMIPDKIIRRYDKTVRKIPFWEHERKLMGAAFFMIQTGKVDGVINVSSFSCGTNAVTGEFITHRASEHKMPLLHLAFDEHTAEAGISTRLEAFVNLIKWKRGQLL